MTSSSTPTGPLPRASTRRSSTRPSDAARSAATTRRQGKQCERSEDENPHRRSQSELLGQQAERRRDSRREEPSDPADGHRRAAPAGQSGVETGLGSAYQPEFSSPSAAS